MSFFPGCRTTCRLILCVECALFPYRLGRYIVACPRAAAPFDTAAQAEEYPERFSVAMALLGEELRATAGRFQGLRGGAPLRLKVTAPQYAVGR